MKKALNMTLFLSFMITIMVPVTGIHVHKLCCDSLSFTELFSHDDLSEKDERKTVAVVCCDSGFFRERSVRYGFGSLSDHT